jgi:hypothetical protein
MGRVLNRHKRGQPKKAAWKKILPRFIVPLLAVGLVISAVYLLDFVGVL